MMLQRPFHSLKTLLVAASLCASALAQAGEASVWQDVQKAGVLRCGAAVAAPYVMRDARSGDYSGYFVDLCRDFGEKVLKVKVQFVDTNWDNLVAGLQSGKWDLAMALNQTPERALAVGFSVAATDYQVSLLVNQENPKVAEAKADISTLDKPDVTFAVMSGTAQDKAISAAVHTAKIMRLPGMDETRLAVMSKRADVLSAQRPQPHGQLMGVVLVLVDASDTNHLFALANPGWAREILPKPALAKQGVAFGVRRDISPADLEALNIYLRQRRDSGDIDQLVDKASIQANAAQ